ncbi:MAG: ChbG/HpnK family deacetylase, partial [Syntrophus sp. (in: bacteria)]
TDHFRGLYLKGRLSLPLLGELLNDLPAGLTELMVHPGRAPAEPGQGPFAAFSTVDREGELDVLLDSKLLNAVKEKGVSLMSFPDILP